MACTVACPRLDRLPNRRLGDLLLAEASTRRARLLGLAGLRSAPADRALLLPSCSSIHTFGMRFALDLVWLGADDRVVGIDLGVQPRRFARQRGAAGVIELPVHSAHQVRERDRLARGLLLGVLLVAPVAE